MRGAIVFREEKVKGEEVTSVKGLSSEMANIDHLMLLAYHSRKVDINLDRMDTLAQGVGRYPLVYPITKSRSAELEKKWEVYKKIVKRFQTKQSLHMCLLYLTPSRLVNCASVYNKSVNPVRVLRFDLSIVELSQFIAGQLSLIGGISGLKIERGETSIVEWMTYRMMLTGAGGDASNYVDAQFNPLKFKVKFSQLEDKEED